MLTEICAEIRNYFVESIHEGTFTISDGKIEPSNFLKAGQYFRIVGSTFNDGVHEESASALLDETFHGAVWAMAVPSAVIALSDEIKGYVESESNKPSPYSSESFGGYSYTKATDSNGVPISWKKVFADRLKNWRKI